MMYCRIIPRLATHRDICEVSDDGNPGAFNAFKHCGARVGIPCLILDILKGFVPVLLACLFLNTQSPLFAIVVAAPVLGHAVGIFDKFRGGKCIAVSFGVTAGLMPVAWIPFTVLAALYIFFSVAVKINPNSKRSLTVYALFALICPTALFATGLAPAALGCLAVAGAVIFRHIISERTHEREVACENDE